MCRQDAEFFNVTASGTCYTVIEFVPFWVIPRRLSSNCRRFGTHHRFHLHRQVNEVYFIHLPLKMEPIVSSETSAIRTQTPGNYPKRNKLHLEHGESLKSCTVTRGFVQSTGLFSIERRTGYSTCIHTHLKEFVFFFCLFLSCFPFYVFFSFSSYLFPLFVLIFYPFYLYRIP